MKADGAVERGTSPDASVGERVALVTGASRGIGAATALTLARNGYSVVLAARSKDALEAVAAEIAEVGGVGVVVPTDALITDELDNLVAEVDSRFGRLDVLVNNAGALPTARLAGEVSLEEWNATMALNLTAPWYLASRIKPLMTRTGAGGVVVNITSSAAFFPSVGFSAYNASKAALTMLTRTLALEWARDGVRVVGVAPGKVDTVLVKPILEFGEKRNLRVNPLGRVGQPEEIAAMVAFVVSADASYVTGCTFSVDGGEVAATGADLAR